MAQACSYWPEAFWAQYQREGLHAYDLWTTRSAGNRTFGRFTDTSVLISDEEFAGSLIYNDFIRSHGDDSFYCAGMVVPLEGGGLATLGLHRPRGHRFGVGMLERGQAIAPHLRRLFALRRRAELIAARSVAAESALAGLASAVLVTDGAGRVVLANAAAEALLLGRSGVRCRRGRLSATDPFIAPRLSAALRAAACGAGAGDLAFPREGQPPLLVSISPSPGSPGHALVLIEDPAAVRPSRLARLSRLFGLSRAEAALAVGLLDGLSTEEVADRRGVGLATVRSQAKSLLRRTGTRRLTEAVALLARSPAPAETEAGQRHLEA